MLEKIHDILHFWFGDEGDDLQEISKSWWKKDEAFDQQIRDAFETTLIDATHGKCDVWLEQPISCLAYIILHDQFPRNIYRNTPQAFSYDDKALNASLHAIEHEFDKDLNLVQRQFMYLPLEHSESIEDQKHSVALFKKLMELSNHEDKAYQPLMKQGYEYAVMHYEVIERFGRFPHRNEILGRTSTQEEIAYLKEPGSGF